MTILQVSITSPATLSHNVILQAFRRSLCVRCFNTGTIFVAYLYSSSDSISFSIWSPIWTVRCCYGLCTLVQNQECPAADGTRGRRPRSKETDLADWWWQTARRWCRTCVLLRLLLLQLLRPPIIILISLRTYATLKFIRSSSSSSSSWHDVLRDPQWVAAFTARVQRSNHARAWHRLVQLSLRNSWYGNTESTIEIGLCHRPRLDRSNYSQTYIHLHEILQRFIKCKHG